LPHDAPAARADRQPHRDFLPPCHRACQKQVGDVSARDYQHEHRGRKQQQQCGTNRSYHFFMQRNHLDAQAGVGFRIRRRQPPRDRIHLCLCLRDGDARTQPREQAQRTARAIGHAIAEHQRRPHLGVRLPEGRELKLPRHHPDDGVIPIRQLDGSTHHVRIAAELPLPQSIADHEDGGRARAIFAARESAAQQRRNAQRGKHVRRHLQARDFFGLVRAGQRSAPGLRRRQSIEGMHLRAIIQKIRRRYRIPAFVQRHHQAARIAIRQRLQQDRIDHAEDGRIRADPQRQHQNGGKRKPRTLDRYTHHPLDAKSEKRLAASISASISPCMSRGFDVL
jgi:hypothetical protein